jgi:beta-glucosidase
MGEVNPSGHLPVGIPREASGGPGTYLAPPLGLLNDVSNLDPTPLYPFGHGLSYGELTWLAADSDEGSWEIGTEVDVELLIRNDTSQDMQDVVQLYLHDPVASVTRPDIRLIGFQRVAVAPGAVVRVRFGVHSDLTSFPGLSGDRVVEPGRVELKVGRSAHDIVATTSRTLTGTATTVGHNRRLTSESDAVIIPGN